MSLVLNGTDGLSDVDGSAATPAIRGTDANTGIFFPAADTIAFSTAGTEDARFDPNGNFGVGTTSPTNIAGYKSVTISSTTGGWLEVTNGTVRGALQNGSGDVTLETRSAHPLIFGINGSEKGRFDTSGNLLVGRTTNASTAARAAFDGGGSFNAISCVRAGTGFQTQIEFFNPNGGVGYIYTSGSSTFYITSSDYRLKEDIQPMTGALAKVVALKPVTYKWKTDGAAGQGFIAHELAEVVPDCVAGEKDGVDAEGNPRYQGIDTSFLVATLTAAIQEQQAVITALTARVEALEGTQP
jgi:hypothetical protein